MIKIANVVNKNKIFFIIFNIIFILFLAIFIYLLRPIETSKVVFIPKGSIKQIITFLVNRKFNLSILDAYILNFIGKPQSGWIDIGKTKLSRFEFLYKLSRAKAALLDISLIPGETNIIFMQEVAKKIDLNLDHLLYWYDKLSPIKDGFIVPNTYKVPKGISEQHLIYYLINLSKQWHKKNSEKIFRNYDEKRWFDFLIVASIIQKEAANINEMPLVASVIYNRLRKNIALQMDGTLNYGVFSHQKITSQRIKTDKSKFNTYLNRGLPPYPVSSVSIDAIKAAIFPAKSEYLYFVIDRKNKKHIFSKTLTEHNRNISK